MAHRLKALFLFVSLAFAGVACLASPGPAAAMDFNLVRLSRGEQCRPRCPEVMVATGDMDLGTADAFLDFSQKAAARGASKMLIIDSPGGHLIEGMKLGFMLRSLGISIFVGRVGQQGGGNVAFNGSCMSACVYALMGGSKRFVMPGSRVGIHRELLPGSTGNDPISVLRSQRRFPQITQMVRNYAEQMGVDPALVDLAEQYGAGGLRILTPDDLTRFRLATIAP
ncbi:hypothetical protein [Labrys monachus]|uniref:Periplasmic protein-like protein n=1 Tax=Labrys monachus TaxID=217067 RepID=A0ABU0FI89_9HYPH|nr:hypothetical protein [Labrys monachus]MDQ0393839.1 hypothetical protein [Labrys monachus]